MPEPTLTDLNRMVAAATRLGAPDHHSFDDAGDPLWEWCRPGKRFGVCVGDGRGETGWFFAHKDHRGATGMLTALADLDQIAADCGFFDEPSAASPPGEAPIVTAAKQRWAVGFQKRVALIRRLFGI